LSGLNHFTTPLVTDPCPPFTFETPNSAEC